jgi:uncharacterized repeat protein (TIGR03806 family)
MTATPVSAQGHCARAGAWARAVLLLAAMAGCSRGPEVQFHDADHYPQRLSDWGILVREGDGYRLGNGVEPYDINSALFTDHALKLRTVYLPPDQSAGYTSDGPLDLPIGSVISKTFFYPVVGGTAIAADGWSGNPADLDAKSHRVIETRLLVRQPHGWDALPYVWDGEEAYLKIAGDLQPMQVMLGENPVELPYVVPTRNECAGCHATDHGTGALQPIGLQARHLNGGYAGGPDNQLLTWQSRGTLSGLPDLAAVPRTADWQDPELSLETRARAYLDINCGHCHNAEGAAATSGLLLDAATTDFRQLGFCKRPIAAGRGSGGHLYSIVPGEPEASILVFRMTTNDPAMRMPELGRSLVHDAAVEAVSDWIASLPGDCV